MKNALVTGGNKGIGFAACKGLAEQGFRVFLASRNDALGTAACEQLRAAGVKNIEPISLNVADEKSIEAAAKKIATFTQHLDALVNNAGVFLDQKATALTIAPSVIFDTLTTNTIGPLLVTRAMLPLLEAAGNAQIINVSSSMGQLSDMQGGSPSYRISKTALNAVTRMLANELADKHIHVNSICPGWVKTDMGGQGASRTPEQGADTIVWLATGGAGKNTGGFYRDRAIIAW